MKEKIKNLNLIGLKKLLDSILFKAKEIENQIEELQNNSGGGDFIPLTGTEEGKPVVGSIEYQDYTGWIMNVVSATDSNYHSGIYADDGNFNVKTENILTGKFKQIELGGDNTSGISFSSEDSRFVLSQEDAKVYSINPLFKGFNSHKDYSEIEPENKLIYAQRSYVDAKAGIPLTGTEEGNPVTGPITSQNNFITKDINGIPNGQFGQGNSSLYKVKEVNGIFIQSSNFEQYINEEGKAVLNFEQYDDEGNITYDNYLFMSENGIENSEDHSGSDPTNKLIYAQRSYVDKANSYSTDEVKTGGTWIDGKHIYRKVFVINGIIGNSVINQLVSQDIDTVISIKGNYLTSNKKNDIISNNSPNDCSRIEVSLEDEWQLNIYRDDTSTNITYNIILEYTKTTD